MQLELMQYTTLAQREHGELAEGGEVLHEKVLVLTALSSLFLVDGKEVGGTRVERAKELLQLRVHADSCAAACSRLLPHLSGKYVELLVITQKLAAHRSERVLANAPELCSPTAS